MKLHSFALTLVSAALLSACSGGSDSPTPATQIHGMASQGGTIQGYINVAGAAKATALKPIHDGKFQLALDGQPLPMVMRIEGTSAGQDVELYSVVLDGDASYINLSPLTRVLISMVTGVDAEQVYQNPANYREAMTKAAFADAQSELKEKLVPLFTAAEVPLDIDLLRAESRGDYQGLDAVMAVLKFAFTATEVVISDSISHKQLNFDYATGHWDGELPLEYSKHDLNVVADADALMEEIILLNKDEDHPRLTELVHSEAEWFGAIGQTDVVENFHNGANAEVGEMNRYRDLEIVDKDGDNSYLIVFTERFEHGVFANASRQRGWFTYEGDQLTFQGDKYQLPTSSNLFFKATWHEAGYFWAGEQDFFEWRLEVDAFLDSERCSTIETSPVFIADTFPEFRGFSSVRVSGEGITDYTINAISRDEANGNCHLGYINEQGHFESPMMNGIVISDMAAVEGKQNLTYTMTFLNGAEQQIAEKSFTLSKGPTAKEEMLQQFMARKAFISGEPENFSYQWQRPNPFVIEADLWVHHGVNGDNRVRVGIDDGKQQAQSADLSEVKMVFHTAFDPYGRLLMNAYVGQNGATISNTPLQ
ncbi:hypothetical protein [Ferrimonas senticii]|uniref:hypothetical protein n=1 Tax=Ferrimonas senticii TaxID=394566 RepID=UPI0003F95533|nr:hypothetical protein [Ferrimonas senticii]